MNPFADLSEENHSQVRKYLRFFRQKRDGMLRALKREISDVQDERIHEDMYTKDDMMEYSDYLGSAIHVSIAIH